MTPAIIIGAGRSGSTLLASILGAHPDFYMPAETGFLLPKMFRMFWEEPEYLSKTKLSTYLQRLQHKDMLFIEFVEKFRDRLGEHDEQYSSCKAKEERRMVDLVRDTFLRVIKPEEFDEPNWGFKEIWNGMAGFDYGWGVYNRCFPDARWIHIVRNPFDFSRSSITWSSHVGWSSDKLTLDTLTHQLGNWVTVVNRSREQADREFMEIRYDDLISTPELVIERMFQFIGLEPTEECFRAMEFKYHKSPAWDGWPRARARHFRIIPGLLDLMAYYDFSSPYD